MSSAGRPRTHLGIDHRLCGAPRDLAPGRARVSFTATPEMAVDEHGLAHGGFVFGVADHAAMLAVNHPNVVLGEARTRFLKPVAVGQELEAEARVTAEEGRRRRVVVEVRRGAEVVMAGEMTCFVLDHHVLAPAEAR